MRFIKELIIDLCRAIKIGVLEGWYSWRSWRQWRAHEAFYRNERKQYWHD